MEVTTTQKCVIHDYEIGLVVLCGRFYIYTRLVAFDPIRFAMILQIYVGALSAHYEALSVEASKATTAEEIVSCIVDRLILPVSEI